MRYVSALTAGALVGGLLFASPVPGSAQTPDDDLDREEMLERIETYYQQRLARELEIAPEERPEFFAVISEFDDARMELVPRRMQLLSDVRDLLRGEGTEAGAEALIMDYREQRRAELDLQTREEDRLLEIISPTQVLRLQILREEFRNEIRRLQDDDPDDRTPPRRRGFRDWLPGFRR